MKLLIADDQTLFREMLKKLLSQENDITICAALSNGREVIEYCERNPIDLALLDIRMPEIDGINTAQRLQSISPRTKIILLTAFEEKQTVTGAIYDNIYGFLLKDIKSDLLVQTVKMVSQGKSSPKSWCKLSSGICMNQVTTCRYAARSANASFLAVSLSSK